MKAKKAARRHTKKTSNRKREKKERSQDQILVAAFEESSADGYTATRLDEVLKIMFEVLQGRRITPQ